MKSHKDHVATLALALSLGLVPAAALAQEPAPAPPLPAPTTAVVTKDSPTAKRQKLLLKGIKLTADQQLRADSLLKRYDQQLPVLQPGTPPDSATTERMRLLYENHDTELRVALNPEQQKVFDKNREELRRQPIG